MCRNHAPINNALYLFIVNNRPDNHTEHVIALNKVK